MSRPDQLKPLNGFDFTKEDICKALFRHGKTAQAARLFIEWLKTRGGEASREEVSTFAHDLANGRVREGFTYKRSNFYRSVLGRLISMGFMSLQPRFDPKRKSKVSYRYAPVRQPIPKKPPLGGETFWHKAWHLCRSWNKEFE